MLAEHRRYRRDPLTISPFIGRPLNLAAGILLLDRRGADGFVVRRIVGGDLCDAAAMRVGPPTRRATRAQHRLRGPRAPARGRYRPVSSTPVLHIATL